MERTAYGRTNASLTRLRGSAQRPAEGKGLDRGFSLRQNLTPNRTARLVISGGSIVTPGATSIMVNPKRKKEKRDIRISRKNEKILMQYLEGRSIPNIYSNT